ncbi:TerC family protein [Abyssalbus ytuae]|uniref:TerC family protein n=1 Tax=Abyssalbus ytuae TaxID=2926907 RepID=A0A9E7CU42_9FLAO|nr:TerC family protein [Abyssalbus ytuae]UOB17577.1 TerC family protein [Abyssalbus ytuae]
MMEIFSAEAIGALVTLTFLEIVLGIDNIIFISIAAGKLPDKLRKKATNIGLILAMVLRIILLFGISYLIKMQKPWFSIENDWINTHVTGQSLILIAGGLFLLYKSTKEIHEKIEDKGHDEREVREHRSNTLRSAILQITLINIVFSFDSILTAIGMTNGLDGALTLMIIAVVLSVLIMMLFANPVGEFVNKHPSIQVLGLSFLILIGFMLIAEGAHLSHTVMFQQEIGSIPKGYLYFAISFSLLVEFLNMKMRKNSTV